MSTYAFPVQSSPVQSSPAKIWLAAFVAAGALLLQTPAQAESSWREIQRKGVLRCGAALSDPHVMKDPRTGQYSGTFVELCRDFGENVLKVKVEMVDATWETIVAGIQGNKWDIGMAMNSTPERALAVTFSQQVTDYQVAFYMHKDNPKLAGLGSVLKDYDRADITFVAMTGTPQEKSISRYFKNAKIMRLTEMDATRLALMSKRADIISDDNATGHLFAIANDWVREVYPQPALDKTGLSFGVAREMSAADLKALNLYLNHQRDLGRIDALIEQASQQAVKNLTK